MVGCEIIERTSIGLTVINEKISPDPNGSRNHPGDGLLSEWEFCTVDGDIIRPERMGKVEVESVIALLPCSTVHSRLRDCLVGAVPAPARLPLTFWLHDSHCIGVRVVEQQR